MLAYDFPLLSLTILAFIIGIVIFYVFALIWAFIDNFRRRDQYQRLGSCRGVHRPSVIPVLGLLFYIGTRPVDVDVVVT